MYIFKFSLKKIYQFATWGIYTISTILAQLTYNLNFFFSFVSFFTLLHFSFYITLSVHNSQCVFVKMYTFLPQHTSPILFLSGTHLYDLLNTYSLYFISYIFILFSYSLPYLLLFIHFHLCYTYHYYIRRKGNNMGNSKKKKKKSNNVARSEERRVGKECRSRWSPYH